MTSAGPEGATIWRNTDVDWDRWPVQTYLEENYRELHPSDAAVIEHHAAFFRRFGPQSVARTVEVGSGPNLYPFMLAAAASRSVTALEPSSASVAYLEGQVRGGADRSWEVFYEHCRQLNPDLPATLDEALARVDVLHRDMSEIEEGAYDIASMNFVAESITEDVDEVRAFCRIFARSVRVGGHLVAAFMENMARYELGDGSSWPGCPLTTTDVEVFFAPYTDELVVCRIDADPTLPDFYGGYTGMILLTARRST